MSSNEVYYFTFIYASNCPVNRFKLWSDLALLNTLDIPWALLGDFNNIQSLSESSGGRGTWTNDMQMFKDFLSNTGLTDLRAAGPHHTWCNNQENYPISRKLDRILGNHSWFSTQQNSHALFTPWGLSDHCAGILQLHSLRAANHKQFAFFNFWLDHPDFLSTVQEAWNVQISGNPMFVLAQKLKQVKYKLVKLNKATGNSADLIKSTREELCKVQVSILENPSRSDLIAKEKSLHAQLWNLLSVEESVQHQKSRV